MARTVYRMYGKFDHGINPPVLKNLGLKWDSTEQRYVEIEHERKSDEEDIN